MFTEFQLDESLKKLDLSILNETFANNAKIAIKIHQKEAGGVIFLKKELPKDGNVTLVKGEHFRDSNLSKFSITLTLTGGTGHLAWQHAQLFRQSLITDRSTPAFQLTVTLE